MKQIKILLKTGFFHIFGSSVMNKIVGFLSSVVLVRILSKSEYGVFTYAWNIYSIVLLANGCGIENGLLQICSEHSGDKEYGRRIYRYALRIGFAFDVVLVIILIGIGLFAHLPLEESGILLIWLCVLPMFKLGYMLIVSYLRSQKRNQEYAKISIVNMLLIFCATTVGAYILKTKGVILGYYVAYGITILLGAVWQRADVGKTREPLSIGDKRILLSVSTISMCNSGLSHLMYYLDLFVLGMLAVKDTVLASYRVATLIPSALVFIPMSLVTYIYPYFCQNRADGEWCIRKYRQILISIGTVNLLISLGTFILAPWLICILFGEIYLDAIPVFRVLILNYFVSGTFRIISGNLLVTQRELKYNFLVALVSGMLNIVADFILIRHYGSMGAALATVLVTAVSSTMSVWRLIYTFTRRKKSLYGEMAI